MTKHDFDRIRAAAGVRVRSPPVVLPRILLPLWHAALQCSIVPIYCSNVQIQKMVSISRVVGFICLSDYSKFSILLSIEGTFTIQQKYTITKSLT